MAIELFQSDDTTPVTDLAITNYDAGSNSDTLTVHVWNDKGNGGGQAVSDVLFGLRTEDPQSAGSYLATGVPPQDELWGRMRIVGFDNTGDATFSVDNTDWRNVGAFAWLMIGAIPADCAVYVEVRFRPPAAATSTTYRHELISIYDENSQPAPLALHKVAAGIVHGVGDASHSGVLSGCDLSASSTPDDEVHSAPGFWVHKGTLYGKTETDHVGNQTDGSSQALAVGESYWLLITLGAGTTTETKGDKGTTPVKPAVPAGELFVGYAEVKYDAGGSTIETGDIDTTRPLLYDRYHAVDGGGLTLDIHPGQAVAGGTWRYSAEIMPVALTDDTTNYVWQSAAGTFTATTTSAPPDDAAVLFFEVLTASGSISSITDRRVTAGELVTLRIRGDISGTGEIGESLVVQRERLFVERVFARLSDNGGTAGSTTLDVELDATTIFTTQTAGKDQRPDFAHDASTLTSSAAVPEVVELRRDQVVTLHVDAVTTGGEPSWAEIYLLCRAA